MKIIKSISLMFINDTKSRTILIPFYDKISQKIKRILNTYNINTIFRVNSKLNSFIKLGKDLLNINGKKSPKPSIYWKDNSNVNRPPRSCYMTPPDYFL